MRLFVARRRRKKRGAARAPKKRKRKFLDFVGDLFSAGADLVGDIAGGLFGGGDSGSGLFGLGLDIFGGGDGGLFNSPIAGHILGAVGTQLMQPTAEERAEEAAAIIRAQEEARQATIRQNYGLPAEHGDPIGVIHTPPQRRTAGNGLGIPRTRSMAAYAY